MHFLLLDRAHFLLFRCRALEENSEKRRNKALYHSTDISYLSSGLTSCSLRTHKSSKFLARSFRFLCSLNVSMETCTGLSTSGDSMHSSVKHMKCSSTAQRHRKAEKKREPLRNATHGISNTSPKPIPPIPTARRATPQFFSDQPCLSPPPYECIDGMHNICWDA